jgi:hypothetical protein
VNEILNEIENVLGISDSKEEYFKKKSHNGYETKNAKQC